MELLLRRCLIHAPSGRRLFPFLPWGDLLGGAGRSHGDRHVDCDLTRASYDPGEFFPRWTDGLDDKFRSIVSFKARIKERGVLLRQQYRFINLSSFVNVAKVRSGKYSVASLTTESYPSAVTGPAMPGFASVAIDFEASSGMRAGSVCGLEIQEVQVTFLLEGGEAAVITHA